ncbi:MAG: hypothetical protein WD067_00375 [Gaiellaceae bacterium]
MRRARVAAAVAAALAGAAAGLALGLTRGDHYEATALLQVLPAPEGAETPEESRPADVQAATYASLVEQAAFLQQIRAQVAAGRLTVDELEERVHGRHEAGTALVEVAAEAESDLDARALAADVAGALLAAVQQAARTRSLQAEDELKRRIAVIDADIEAAEGDSARQESLRAQRAALAERLAAETESGVAAAGRLVLAAPAAEARRVRADWWPWALGGAAIGLLAGLLSVGRPRRRLAVTLVAPAAGAFLRGSVAVVTEPPGAGVEWSSDGARWHSVRGALDTAALPDGQYLLRTPGASEATPVVVDNTPPAVALSPPPRFSGGVVLLDAEAEDAGSGVASVTFMVSTGGPDWTEIPSEFAPERPGVYWFSAVAADRAGNRAASELMPVTVDATL